MTECFSEDWIEQLALDHLKYPGNCLPVHLSKCEFCNAGYTAMLELHQTAAQAIAKMDSNSLPSRIGTDTDPSNPHIHLFHSIQLKPIELTPPIYQKTLAADTGQIASQTGRVRNLSVFSSTDGGILVRILKGVDGKTSLFLLSDEPGHYQHVLVRILGLEREYVTDSKGSAYLGDIDLPEIDDLGLEVRTASHSYDLKTIFPQAETMIGESEIVLADHSERKIKLDIMPAGTNYSLRVTLAETAIGHIQKRFKVMVVRDEHSPLVRSSIQGVALFQELKDPQTVQVKIFE
ncbi:MAG: hypothetical protein L3J79_02680 [Candidatus Marinimicrobia bacterium]|nr:hypothetical protein [Candidatus Neomarinimicrobiota bacterium]